LHFALFNISSICGKYLTLLALQLIAGGICKRHEASFGFYEVRENFKNNLWRKPDGTAVNLKTCLLLTRLSPEQAGISIVGLTVFGSPKNRS
jgi:hypothetical protein